MNKKTVKINSVVTAVALLIYAAGCVLNLLVNLIFPAKFSIPVFVPLWLSVMIPCAILLIHGIKNVKQSRGVLHLITSAVSLLVGVAWGFFEALSWAIYILLQHAVNTTEPLFDMSLGDYLNLLNVLNRVNEVMIALCAILLLAVFVINVLIARPKWLQIKAELHKPIAAALILVQALFSLVLTLLNTLVLGRLGTDAYVVVNQIFGICSFAIGLLMSITFAVLALVLGLAFKKQPVQGSEPADPDPAPVQHIDLPVGVDPNSLDT